MRLLTPTLERYKRKDVFMDIKTGEKFIPYRQIGDDGHFMYIYKKL